MEVKAGDVVKYGNVKRIVVDVDQGDPPLAVLRTPKDMELKNPIAVSVHELEILDHLTEIEGWTEDSLGVWSQT